MEGNLAQGGIIQGGGGTFGGFDLPGSMRVNRQAQHTMNQHQAHPCQGSSVHSSIHDGFPLTMGTLQNCDQTMSMNEFGQGDRNKHSGSEEDEPEEGGDGHHQEGSRGKKCTPWQRVKWTDKMVRLLITAVSYIGEDGNSEGGGGGGGRRKFAVLQKKGKWKSISKVMAERGYRVSPQQCEDKFNDLNKRYKKLNDMLGRGTSCQVVENPALLDEYHKSSHPHGQAVQTDGNQALPENMRAAWLQKQWLDSHSVQLEEQKLQIQVEMLELEKQRFKWERFNKKQDRELEKFKLENDRMKIENERIALELKRKEIGGTSFN
ncbi:hypothetical protein TSUD_288020 [Trifolium subterraneum]|uniref:Myb/SANT-like DNA-binding domain-containing protein n=1 Tax=Trifolium subterraneum TaxID=3900 RepID=A0A2Z6P1J3_TRISU|nr:hypothetical protein TSUD_288020 [Trifolium subterraneum]